jgi:hypothetical protein
MRRLSMFTAAVLALTCVAGCSSAATPAAGSSPTVSASPSKSAPPADGGTYSGTDALLAALTAAGIPCGSPQAVANATAPGAIGLVDCDSPGGSSGDSVLAVFDTQAHAQGYAESMTGAGLGALAAPAVVYGGNWAVNTTAAYAAQIRVALGGGVLAGPSPAAS